MKKYRKALSLAAVLIVSGSLAGGANAALTLQSYVFTGYGKDASGAYIIDSDSTTGLDTVSANSSDTFEHADDPGNFLGFTGFASASSAPQRLRTHARGTVTNNYYDSDYDYDLNEGTPSYYVSWAEAEYSETLQYGGTATNYNSRYIMRFTGNIIGVETFTLVEITHGSGPRQQWFFDTPGSYNEMIISEAFVHGGSPQEINVRVFEFLPDGYRLPQQRRDCVWRGGFREHS